MKKWFILQTTALVLLLSICIFKNVQKNRLYDQNANDRWGNGLAQISIFYPLEEKPSGYFQFLELSHRIETDLEKSAVSTDIVVDGSSGLSFPWSVCTTGKITVSSDRGDVQLEALGVSEDFFVFHPVELVYGSYIQAGDLMQDGIVIDEDAAWKLFGASDVAGMQVTIGGVPHYIKGVVHKSDDRFSAKAGLEKSMCYTSIETLSSYGTIYGSYAYEIILPNPVNNFAINLIRNTLGQSSETLQIVENSNRFDNSKIHDIMLNFGVRSMSSSGVIYPYYENVARAWEDAFALILFIEYVLAAFVIVVLLVQLFILYRAGKIRKPHPFKWLFRVIVEMRRDAQYSDKSEKRKARKEKRRKEKLQKKQDDIIDLDEELEGK